MNAIHPIKPADENTKAEKQFLFSAKRTNAGRSLPEYYLCYFLLVDLLGFRNLGQFEKISWSVPIDYNGDAYLIEHRKFGVGVFAHDPDSQEEMVAEIVSKIQKAVKIARPFFEWKAQEAAKLSKLNVKNHHRRLFDRYSFFIDQYKKTSAEAKERSDENIVKKHNSGDMSITRPYFQLQQNSEWLALSTMDAFFSWTEHIFILTAILKGQILNGEDVASLADVEWAEKYKRAVGIKGEKCRSFYDHLVTIKRQLRNYMAHGAFGKRGEAFSFHSGAGAVPMLMPHQKGSSKFSFFGDLAFNDAEVISLIEDFIIEIWSDELSAAKLYIESGLPLILTMANDGGYAAAIESDERMSDLVERLTWEFDRAANMDW